MTGAAREMADASPWGMASVSCVAAVARPRVHPA